jgi:lysozyme
MMEKYTVNSESAQAEKAAEPAPSPKQDLYRTFLNLEMGDTQQEREYLKGAARESTKVKTDPILLRRWASKYAMSVNEDPSDILLNEPETDGLFNAAPTRQAPVAPEVKSTAVFSDPDIMEKAIDEVRGATSPVSFKRAFNTARRSGKDEFTYEGDLFNTRKKGESDDEWAEGIGIITAKRGMDRNKVRSQLRVGAQMQSLLSRQPDQSPEFQEISASGSDFDTRVKSMVKGHEGTLDVLRKLGYVDDKGQHNVYQDSENKNTIGYGHLIDKGENLSQISEAEAQALFEKDYAEHKMAAEQIPGYAQAGPGRQAALIDLTFNMGPGWTKKFPDFLDAFQKGDYETAANELVKSKWFKQVKARGPKIVKMMRTGAQN